MLEIVATETVLVLLEATEVELELEATEVRLLESTN